MYFSTMLLIDPGFCISQEEKNKEIIGITGLIFFSVNFFFS